jgi:hypothetical protein
MVEAVRPEPVDDPCDEAIEGRHGVTLGTAVVWLSPGVPRSVAPSPIPEPTTDDDPVIMPPAPDIDPAPEAPVFEAPEPQLFERPDPPPSKAAFEPAFGHGIISGLTPGVLISVEPSGMPPRPEEVELDKELSADGTFSGDVAPMPGVVVCACATATPIQQLRAASKNGYRIEPPSLADVSLTRSGKGGFGKGLTLAGSGAAVLISEHGAAVAVPLRSRRRVASQKAAIRRPKRFRPYFTGISANIDAVTAPQS